MPESIFHKFKDFVFCSFSLGGTPAEKWQIFWRLTKNFRVRLGFARYHPDSVYELPTRYGKLFLRDNFGDVTNLPDLFLQSTYQVNRIEAAGVVLDLGANVGLFAAWIAHHNPGRKIFCFEPLTENAKLIPMNCPGAQVNRFGLGKKSAVVKVDVDEHEIMASSIPTAWPTKKQQIEIKTLDEFSRQEHIAQVAFIKIDTEGMELDVLDGGRKTLEKTQNVAMETHGGSIHRGAIERLRNAGFNILDENFNNKTGMVFASRNSLNGND